MQQFSAEQIIDFLKPYKVTVAASCASFISVGTGYPFDSIKTRMQANNYKNITTCANDVLKLEGFFGFYRGIGPLLISVIFLRSAAFNIFNKYKTMISDFNMNINMPEGFISNILSSNIGQSVLAGGLTGSLQV